MHYIHSLRVVVKWKNWSQGSQPLHFDFDSTKRNNHSLKFSSSFCSNKSLWIVLYNFGYKEKIFYSEDGEALSRLPSTVVDAPSLETLQVGLDQALGNLI